VCSSDLRVLQKDSSIINEDKSKLIKETISLLMNKNFQDNKLILLSELESLQPISCINFSGIIENKSQHMAAATALLLYDNSNNRNLNFLKHKSDDLNEELKNLESEIALYEKNKKAVIHSIGRQKNNVDKQLKKNLK
jgi:hypothetical protein